MITEREVANYPNPISLSMNFVSSEKNFSQATLKAAILTNMADGNMARFDAIYREVAQRIFDQLIRDRDNHELPENNGRYSDLQGQVFLQMSVLPAVPHQFIGLLLAQTQQGMTIDITRFKSIYMQQIAVWIEYYVQKKKGKESDIGDFMFLSYVSYVDTAVLDKERVDLIRRINSLKVLGQNLHVEAWGAWSKAATHS